MRPTTIDSSQVRLSTQIGTLRRLLPYPWPAGRLDLKNRVLIAVVLLVLAKVAAVYVPLILRDAVDSLGAEQAVAFAVPLALLLAYGAARILAVAFAQLRDAGFEQVRKRSFLLGAVQLLTGIRSKDR